MAAQYKLAKGTSLQQLEDAVAGAFTDGWRPQGGVSVTFVPTIKQLNSTGDFSMDVGLAERSALVFYQAMIKGEMPSF